MRRHVIRPIQYAITYPIYYPCPGMDTTIAPWFVYDRSTSGFLYIMHLYAFVFLEGFGSDFVSSCLCVGCTLIPITLVNRIVEGGSEDIREGVLLLFQC